MAIISYHHYIFLIPQSLQFWLLWISLNHTVKFLRNFHSIFHYHYWKNFHYYQNGFNVICIYNSIDLRKWMINFHEWDEFFNFRECGSTSENYENSYSRVKIDNVNFRKSIELCANSGVQKIWRPKTNT